MLYREIITVFSQIHTKHINTLCGQNVELLNVKLAVHIVTCRLLKVVTFSGPRQGRQFIFLIANNFQRNCSACGNKT